MPLLLVLWTLTGLAWVLTVLGMFSVGIFVLPVAVGLLVVSVLRTVQRPSWWPSIAGLGVAGAVGVAWLGWVLANAGPSQLSCSGSSDGPTVCTSGGRVIDPDAVNWAIAVPSFVAACVIALVSVVGYVLLAARMTRSSAAMAGR